MDYRSFLITGKPIDTKFGKVKFLTFEEYFQYGSDLQFMSMNNLHLYYYFKKMIENPNDEQKAFLAELKQSRLIDIIKEIKGFKEIYIKVFNFLIDFEDGYDSESIFESEEDFMSMRKLIMDMNLIIEEEVSKNEELQEMNEIRKKINQSKNDGQTFEDIITSIVAGTSNSFNEVLNMTVYQVYAIFARLAAIIDYNTRVLFATVSSDIDIESWDRNIDLLKRDTKDMRRSEFEQKYGKMFK